MPEERREKERGSDRDRGGEKFKEGKERAKDRDKDSDKDRERRERKERKERKEKDRSKEKRHKDGENEFNTQEEIRKNDKIPKEENFSKDKTQKELQVEKTKELKKHSKENAKANASSKLEEDEDNVKNWVRKSRKEEEKRKKEEMEKAKKIAKMFEEQDLDNEEEDESDEEREAPAYNSIYSSKDLAGLKIMHDVDKIMDNDAIILTLKDTNILEGDDVNDAADELENIEISEQEKRVDAYKKSKKFSTYDDKFDNELDADNEKKMLPQYDDDEKNSGFVITDLGTIEKENQRLNEIRQKLQIGKMKESISDSKPKLESDYLTKEENLEVSIFRKPKKKKKLRKKEKFDIDAFEEEMKRQNQSREGKDKGEGGGGEKESGGNEKGSVDLGSRELMKTRRVEKEKEEKEREEKKKMISYQNAYIKAYEKSKGLRGEEEEDGKLSLLEVKDEVMEEVMVEKNESNTTMNHMSLDVRGKEEMGEEIKEGKVKKEKEEEENGFYGVEGEEEDGFYEEDDMDLRLSLEKTRMMALKKKKEKNLTMGEESVFSKIRSFENEEERKEKEKENGKENEENSVDYDINKLIFTDTGEFCRGIQLDDAITRRSAVQDAFAEEDDNESSEKDNIDRHVAQKDGGGWRQIKDSLTDQSMQIDGEEEIGEREREGGEGEGEEEEEEEEDDVMKEKSIGKGLGNVLNLLKERGVLKESMNDLGGRTMDKKKSKLVGVFDDMHPPPSPSFSSSSIPNYTEKDIRLERLDEFGRVMTPKEAFRKLSHKFHGKPPGKMKQEKRMKQFQEELKMKQLNASNAPLASVEKMIETQQKLNAPYLVLSGNIKPGQTSDPRSAFATVEKESSLNESSLGSLTPMLGDNKVEHFLNMKRPKSSAEGSMKPPKRTKY